MSDRPILTTKDLTLLEVMRDRCPDGHPLAAILDRKLRGARVVLRDDVPANVATLNSRVRFRVDGRDPETRILAYERLTSPIGLFLPVTTARGLALMGLCAGQSFVVPGGDGTEEEILLEAVEYQPEAAKRARDAIQRTPPHRPVLTLIRGALSGTPERMRVGPGGFDDPGPSAA